MEQNRVVDELSGVEVSPSGFIDKKGVHREVVLFHARDNTIPAPEKSRKNVERAAYTIACASVRVASLFF